MRQRNHVPNDVQARHDPETARRLAERQIAASKAAAASDANRKAGKVVRLCRQALAEIDAFFLDGHGRDCVCPFCVHAGPEAENLSDNMRAARFMVETAAASIEALSLPSR